MERNSDNRDFEQFLKHNADQYRMYPSEKVWKEINNTLHTRRRWFGIAALLLLLTGGLVTGVMILNPSKPQPAASLQKIIIPAPVPSAKPVAGEQKFVPVLSRVNINNSIVSGKIPSITITSSGVFEQAGVQQGEQSYITSAITQEAITEPSLKYLNKNAAPDIAKADIPVLQINPENTKTSIVSITTQGKQQTTDEIQKQPVQVFDILSNAPISTASLPKTKEKKKVSLQLYFTPGISYRRLTENKEFILAASGGPSMPTNLALQDVKNLVTHKPDIGFELGLAAKYPLSKRITLKAGLQFNVNKYNIRAFSYSGEQATIAIQGSGRDSVTRTSYYRNFNGYKPNWLNNVYFSISVPAGGEVKIINNKKISLGFGLTLQPTYLLDNNAYLISTDFKNYAKVPDLIRRWNVNTGAELILGFNAGKTKWQIGPQFRYQALSSFKDKYPVKENLLNYGLKAGITLNNQ
jgi:hypothetical protein